MHILQHRSIRALSVVDADALFVMAVRQAVYTHRLDVAERLASVLSSTSRPAEERAIGYHVLAYLAAAQGRWRIARTYADSTRLFSFHYGVETKARLAVVPLAPYATSELTELRREVLTARTVHAKMGKGGYGRYAASQYPDRMVALAGMLSARIGDTAALHSATMALATDDTSSFRPWREWRRDRLGLLRAWSMRIAGRSADAVAALGTPRPPDDNGTRDEERFLLAEVLEDTGHLPEAVPWFGSFEQIGIEDLPWAAPAHLMRARLLDRLGRQREAAADYARVVELWKDCDAELRPLIDEARRGSR